MSDASASGIGSAPSSNSNIHIPIINIGSESKKEKKAKKEKKSKKDKKDKKEKNTSASDFDDTSSVGTNSANNSRPSTPESFSTSNSSSNTPTKATSPRINIPKFKLQLDTLNQKNVIESQSPSENVLLNSDNPFNDILEQILNVEKDIKLFTPRGMTPRKTRSPSNSMNASLSNSLLTQSLNNQSKLAQQQQQFQPIQKNDSLQKQIQRRNSYGSPKTSTSPTATTKNINLNNSNLGNNSNSGEDDQDDKEKEKEKDEDIVPSIDLLMKIIKENNSFIDFTSLNSFASRSLVTSKRKLSNNFPTRNIPLHDEQQSQSDPKRRSNENINFSIVVSNSSASSSPTQSSPISSLSLYSVSNPKEEEALKEYLIEVLSKYRKWLVLKQKNPKENIFIPDDVRFVLRLHLLKPSSYGKMCKKLFGKVVDLQRSSKKASFVESENLWKKEYGTDPFHTIVKATAKFDFEPQSEGELGFKKGDTLIILEKGEDGWWGGESNGRVGYFPSSYIENI